jgi:hypothetical protein
MKIAIDLNDVVRDYSNNFISTYLNYFNSEFDTTDFEMWTNDMQSLLTFKTERAYQKFVYEDYPYELFCKCGTCTKKLSVELKDFFKSLKDYDEPIEVLFVSTMEYGASLSYSFAFIGNLGCGVREVYFPMDSRTIWDKCDILITANPLLLDAKPDDKITIKILTEYNKDSEADYEYKKLGDFINNKENINNLLSK